MTNKNMDEVNKFFKKILNTLPRNILIYIFAVFVISRLVLVVAGLTSRTIFSDTYRDWYEWRYSQQQWLDIWSVWDSAWYLDVAYNGYSIEVSSLPKTCCGQTNTAFFPLYPLLIRFVGNVIKDYPVAGILISNICLLLSAAFLYKLILLDFDQKTAKKSILYLFLFPTSFILSGILTESLFLFLTILCFYFARKNNWMYSGIAGFFLALTRPTGIFLLIPIVYLYLRQNRFKIHKNLAFLLLFPAGMTVFSLYLYRLTGHLFAFSHAEWGAKLSNPITVLFQLFSTPAITRVVGIVTLLELLLLLFAFYKKTFTEYLIFSLLIIVLPLINGIKIAVGIPRMSSIVFPLFLSLALISGGRIINWMMPLLLIIIQIIFMMLWSIGVLIV